MARTPLNTSAVLFWYVRINPLAERQQAGQYLAPYITLQI